MNWLEEIEEIMQLDNPDESAGDIPSPSDIVKLIRAVKILSQILQTMVPVLAREHTVTASVALDVVKEALEKLDKGEF